MPIRAVIFAGGAVLVQGIGDRSHKARWEQRWALEAGLAKPDRRIYELALDRLRV